MGGCYQGRPVAPGDRTSCTMPQAECCVSPCRGRSVSGVVSRRLRPSARRNQGVLCVLLLRQGRTATAAELPGERPAPPGSPVTRLHVYGPVPRARAPAGGDECAVRTAGWSGCSGARDADRAHRLAADRSWTAAISRGASAGSASCTRVSPPAHPASRRELPGPVGHQAPGARPRSPADSYPSRRLALAPSPSSGRAASGGRWSGHGAGAACPVRAACCSRMPPGPSQQPGPTGGDDVRASAAIRNSAAHVRRSSPNVYSIQHPH